MRGIPKLVLVEGEEGYDLISLGVWNNPPGVGALQCATSFDGSSPFSAKAASTSSSTLEGLQFDIAPWIYERNYKFFLSLALLTSLLETPRRTKVLSKKEEEAAAVKER